METKFIDKTELNRINKVQFFQTNTKKDIELIKDVFNEIQDSNLSEIYREIQNNNSIGPIFNELNEKRILSDTSNNLVSLNI